MTAVSKLLFPRTAIDTITLKTRINTGRGFGREAIDSPAKDMSLVRQSISGLGLPTRESLGDVQNETAVRTES